MLKMFTAFTTEIDDPEVAAREILEQLKPEENMLKNTIGLIHFYHKFAEEEIWSGLAAALPFELAGCMASYVGVCGMYSDAAVTVTMLTSDDVSFAVKTVDGVYAKTHEQIAEELRSVFDELSAEEMPKLVMPFMPQRSDFCGEDLVDTVNAFPQKFTLFGMLAFNVDNEQCTQFIAGNGKVAADMFAFVAFYGNVSPKFHIGSSFSSGESLGENAIVTEAEGKVLKSVNGAPALEYLKKIRLVVDDGETPNAGLWTVPAILTRADGAKIARVFTGAVEGTQYVSAVGFIETGAQIGFAHLDGKKTVESAKALVKEISDAGENDVIVFSCAGRAWSLGSKFFDEMTKFGNSLQDYKKENRDLIKYCVTYTGGEICPVKNKDGNTVNALHHYTLIACAFN